MKTIASYFVRNLFHSVLKTISNLSHASPFHCSSATSERGTCTLDIFKYSVKSVKIVHILT